MAVVALGVGFTACNNDDIDGPQDGQKGNTHVSVTLKLSSNALRSAGPGQPDEYNPVGTWAGKDKFDKIRIYLVDGSSVSSSEFIVGTDYTVVDGSNNPTDPTYKQKYLKPEASAAMKTTAGQKTVYVVVNETPAVRNWLNKTPVHEFEQAYKNIALVLENSGPSLSVSTSASKLATINTVDESIVMTTIDPQPLNVLANVSATETIDESVKKNRASVIVERAVARVMVTIKDMPVGGYKIPDPNAPAASDLGTISDITWVVAQGENSLFVQRNKNNPWEWATPSWDFKPSKTEFYAQGTDGSIAGNQKYDYSGLFENPSNHFGGTTVPTYTDYATNKLDDPIELETRWLDGKFILPTTHTYETAPAASSGAAYTGGYVKGNTAYVLIRAKFTPEDAAFADTDPKPADGTFYVGKDGKFYTSTANAMAAGNTEVAKYPEGKILYYAWLNPDQVPNWYNSPVLRNNIYHIHITGFKNLGTNWNPLYPEDPDDPTYDPTNPNNPDPRPVPEDPGVTEPENPIDPEEPLTTSETWMSVDVTVLPWKVHSYEVPLGI